MMLFEDLTCCPVEPTTCVGRLRVVTYKVKIIIAALPTSQNPNRVRMWTRSDEKFW